MIPSGKHTKNYGKSPCLMGKLTISMAIFNSYVWHNQRVHPPVNQYRCGFCPLCVEIMFVGFSCFPMDSPDVFVCLPGHMIWCWQTSESLGWDPMFQLAVKEWYSSPRRNIIWYIYIYMLYNILYNIYIYTVYNHVYIYNQYEQIIWKKYVYLIFNVVFIWNQ